MRKTTILIICSLIFGVTHVYADYWAQATFVKGSVTVQTGGTGEEKPLILGSMLKDGDIVRISEASRASFLINDGSVLVGRSGQTITLGPSKNQAGLKVNVVAQNLVSSLVQTNTDEPMLKHVGGLRTLQNNVAIAPTNTTVRADQEIVFLWLPRPPVRTFTLVIMDDDDFYQEYNTSGNTSFKLAPGTLKPAKKYSWEIHDGARDVAMLPLGSGFFTVASTETINALEAAKNDIMMMYKQSDTKEDMTPHFLMYQLYLKYGFSIEALMTVEHMLEKDPHNSHVLKLKHDLQRIMNLHDSDIVQLKKEITIHHLEEN